MLKSLVLVGALITLIVAPPSLLAIDADSKQTTNDVRITARSQAEPYIDWFPEESETLTVLHSQYRIPAEYPTSNMRSFSVRMRENMMGVIFAGELRQLLAGKTVEMTIEAACRFRIPVVDPPITPLIYDGCCIFVFDPNSPLDEQEILSVLEKSGVKRGRRKRAWKHTVEGRDVLEYHPLKYNPERFNRSAPPFSYWIALPAPNLLVIATHESFVQTVLKRIGCKPTQPAFARNLDEWKHIEASAEQWGIRHFRTDIGESDLSDLRRPWGNDPEGTASGIAWQINTSARQARITVLGCDDLMIRRLTFGARNAVDQEASVVVGANGTLQIDINWSNQPQGQMKRIEGRLSNWLQHILGYAVVL